MFSQKTKTNLQHTLGQHLASVRHITNCKYKRTTQEGSISLSFSMPLHLPLHFDLLFLGNYTVSCSLIFTKHGYNKTCAHLVYTSESIVISSYGCKHAIEKKFVWTLRINNCDNSTIKSDGKCTGNTAKTYVNTYIHNV